MVEMNFPAQFINWIMIAVRTVSYRYMINGHMSRILQAKRGLRQGDPISPLLFVLTMEYLHRTLGELKTDKDYQFHPKCAKLGITNLYFADDLLLFSRGDEKSVQALMKRFDQFADSTGLKANPAKCKIYFGGISDQIQHQIAYGIGQLPFKYLGVPLASRKITINQCQPLINRMLEKIHHWSSNMLSYAGRQQLIKSTMMTITGYWMQVFPLHKSVIKRIDIICKNFLWFGKATGRKALVS
ncbi:uncharacterized protein LOC131645922 [Vicia villosa]|uniref:uncharacterized protein LOC131645922 n=1 Tax=Vicia villosa TaxID=3911 RepID=UPI00273CCE54|nr:uncharacterized protein LOC131645922 [Vicia villosa]